MQKIPGKPKNPDNKNVTKLPPIDRPIVFKIVNKMYPKPAFIKNLSKNFIILENKTQISIIKHIKSIMCIILSEPKKKPPYLFLNLFFPLVFIFVAETPYFLASLKKYWYFLFRDIMSYI